MKVVSFKRVVRASCCNTGELIKPFWKVVVHVCFIWNVGDIHRIHGLSVAWIISLVTTFPHWQPWIIPQVWVLFSSSEQLQTHDESGTQDVVSTCSILGTQNYDRWKSGVRCTKRAMSHFVRKSVPAESGGELGDACPKMPVDEVESSKSKAEISWLKFWWTSFMTAAAQHSLPIQSMLKQSFQFFQRIS